MTGTIRVSETFPRYWRYAGEPTVLLGGSSEDNLFQLPDVESELDDLASVGGNYVRCTMSSREDFAVWPFAEVEPGRYDLDAWNEAYWNRFETFLAATETRDVVVQIEVWATWDFFRQAWRENPFNPACNTTYSAEESGLETALGDAKPHTEEAENAFFDSVPAERDLESVRSYQERYVEKLLDHSLAYDNVLYCIDNETSASPAWPDYWADFIQEVAATRGREVPVTEMWLETDLTHEQHDAVFDHPDRYDFVEASQNNGQVRDVHWANLQAVRESVAAHPRPINNVKIYGGQTHWTDGPDQGFERFWRNLLGGAAAARFHRPPAGNGLDPRVQRHLRSARLFLDKFDVFRAIPDADHEVLLDRPDNEANCSLIDGEAYAVYFPDGGSVELDVPPSESGWMLDWLSVDDCEWFRPDDEPIEDTPLELDTWALGHWVALVTAA